jgi:methionyl-tRNA formyltransferase
MNRKSQKCKIVFFGTPQFAALVLQKLIEEKLSPKLVITAPDKPVGRKQILTPSPVKILVQKNKIPTATLSKIRDNREILDKIRKLDPDLIVVAAYGKILPKELLDIPKYGSLNVHASILPKYRGASPIQTAILAGETETGVTIILMDEKMDEGNIIALKKAAIEPKDTYQSLSEKLAQIGADLLAETIYLYLSWCEAGAKRAKPKGRTGLSGHWITSGESASNKTPNIKNKSLRLNKQFFLPSLPQNHSKATYTKIIKKEDGQIDPNNPPKAEKLDRMIHALYPWPGVWTRYQISDGRYQLIKFLPNDPFLIQPEGKRPMTIKEFLNGHPEAKFWLEKIVGA